MFIYISTPVIILFWFLINGEDMFKFISYLMVNKSPDEKIVSIVKSAPIPAVRNPIKLTKQSGRQLTPSMTLDKPAIYFLSAIN